MTSTQPSLIDPVSIYGPPPEYETAKRFMFIGCSKTKCERTRFFRTPEQLYQGDLFKRRVAAARRLHLPWFALSAKYGIWHPDTRLRWYDQTFDDLCKLDRAAWAPGVVTQFLSSFDDEAIDPASITVELHAGADYVNPLFTMLQLAGFKVDCPSHGLGIGQQRAYYDRLVA